MQKWIAILQDIVLDDDVAFDDWWGYYWPFYWIHIAVYFYVIADNATTFLRNKIAWWKLMWEKSWFLKKSFLFRGMRSREIKYVKKCNFSYNDSEFCTNFINQSQSI